VSITVARWVKMGGGGKKLVLGVFPGEWIKTVSDAGRIDYEDRSESRSVACGLSEKLTLDVVDNDRVTPGEKLGSCK
jgi:hypothetical protein